MSPPLCSIVITNHDYGRFVGEAIESALAQRHPALDVLVVDDGSTDDSLEVIARYPVRLIRSTGQGVIHARNLGACRARGELLLFLDADDVLDVEYVGRCHAALASAPRRVAYAYTHMRMFGTEERIFEAHPFSAQRLIAGNFIHVSALMRRDVFLAIGGYNPRFALGWEDYELWVRMLDRGYTGVLVPEPLLHYRQHGQNRNRLSEQQLDELRWRIRLSYPRSSVSQILRHPVAAARWALRLRGRLGQPDEPLRDPDAASSRERERRV
jgi:glycosyltransferase involved in cell wall biosynthesis